MKCPLCGKDIPVESKLIGSYIIFQPPTKGVNEGGEIVICGQCFLLVNILEVLKEIRDDRQRNK